jgi:transcriptional regulator with XRE-family HTH domain
MMLAEKLKTMRTDKGWNVAELSEQSGVSKPYIWQIEDGRRKNPSGDVLRKLASALGTTVADLMDAPAGIPESLLADVPETLREFAQKRGKLYGVKREDIEMLKHIHFRGRRPGKPEDWELIFLFLKRILE